MGARRIPTEVYDVSCDGCGRYLTIETVRTYTCPRKAGHTVFGANHEIETTRATTEWDTARGLRDAINRADWTIFDRRAGKIIPPSPASVDDLLREDTHLTVLCPECTIASATIDEHTTITVILHDPDGLLTPDHRPAHIERTYKALAT